MEDLKKDAATMTAEERKAMREALDAIEKSEQAKYEEQKKKYKESVNTKVSACVKDLREVSERLSIIKSIVYDEMASLIRTKTELYGCKSGQNSHTFSDDAGNSITIGYRVVDAFDDTLDMGIAKVRGYIESLIEDDKSRKLVEMINRLLKKDAKGNLKPSRILDLQNLADKEQDPLLTEGVTIIRESYKPKRSVIFVEAEQMNGIRKETLPLSITSADFARDYEPDLSVFI